MMINQKWSPEAYHLAGSFVPDLASDLLNDLNPKPNEKILDLGCGNGVLTKKILRSTKYVIGIDSSDAMVQAAKKIGIDSYLIDGEAIPFRNVFDTVFSNAALHWIQNQDAVLRGVHKSLKPKGRFVGEFGGHGNVSCLIAIIETVMKAKPPSKPSKTPSRPPENGKFHPIRWGPCTISCGRAPGVYRLKEYASSSHTKV